AVVSIALDGSSSSSTPAFTATAYVVVAESDAATPGRLAKTTDQGQTWSTLGVSIPAASGATVVLDPRTPSTLYVTIYDSNQLPVGPPRQNQLWKSVDGGATFTALSPSFSGALRALAIDPADSKTLYATCAFQQTASATTSGAIVPLSAIPGSVSKSTDGGAT